MVRIRHTHLLWELADGWTSVMALLFGSEIDGRGFDGKDCVVTTPDRDAGADRAGFRLSVRPGLPAVVPEGPVL
jgi:hypothetical protein